MSFFDAIGDALGGAVDFADAIFGFSTGNEGFGLLSAGANIFSSSMGEGGADFGGAPGIAGGDLYDLMDPGFGGHVAGSGGDPGGNGLLSRQLAGVQRDKPKSDFWSNPFVGNIMGAVGQELLRGDPAEEAGKIASAQHEARRKSIAKNYRLPKRRVPALPAPKEGA